jgi:hypothetical protein
MTRIALEEIFHVHVIILVVTDHPLDIENWLRSQVTATSAEPPNRHADLKLPDNHKKVQNQFFVGVTRKFRPCHNVELVQLCHGSCGG